MVVLWVATHNLIYFFCFGSITMVVDLPIKSGKPIKIGNSYYFSVPYQYVDNGAVRKNRLYDLQVGKNLLLEARKVSKKAGTWVFLIDIIHIKEKVLKVDRRYNLLLNEAMKGKPKKK